MAPQTKLTPGVLKDISWGNKTLYKMMDDAQNGFFLEDNETVRNDIEYGVKNGTIGTEDVMKAYEGGYISGENAIVNLNAIFSPLSTNKKTEAYNIFKTNLDSELKDMFNSIGIKSKTNVKKQYIEENMDRFFEELRYIETIDVNNLDVSSTTGMFCAFCGLSQSSS